MRNDTRLSRMLHVLLHMSQGSKNTSSTVIAEMLGTNPVVVRRTMAGLRDAGYVSSIKGQGGGWVLTKELKHITLHDVYMAVGEPPLFSLGWTDDNPNCLVEKAVNTALRDTLEEARAQILKRFSEVSLAELSTDFDLNLLHTKPS